MECWSRGMLESMRTIFGWLLTLVIFYSRVAANEPLALEMASPDADRITKVLFPATASIERADLYFWKSEKAPAPQAMLVLAPGRNGNGRNLITDAFWKQYATAHNLALCGVSFASKQSFREESYSNTTQSGSGNMLLAGISTYLGEPAKDIPILIYGFSAGARFAASFVEANSERVLAWCGQAVGLWEDAKLTKEMPPGIVATGEYDAGCYHASILYFQQGRKLGKPWIWLCLEELGHQRSKPLDEFVSAFFGEILAQKSRQEYVSSGGYFDIDTRKELSEGEVADFPIFATWLPQGKVRESWLKLHHP